MTTSRIKTFAVLALASACLVPAPASAQSYGGDPGMAAMLGIAGAVLGGLGGGQAQGYGYQGYGGGYGYRGNQAGYGAYDGGYGGYGGYGGGYGCRVVLQRGYDAWGNPVAQRRRICD